MTREIGKSKVALFTSCLVVGITQFVGVAPSASALGYDAWLCGRDNQWAGQSTSGGASTKETSASDCGSVKVRAFYKLYSGSQTYYTGWAASSSYVFVNPGNIMLGGNHAVTSCGVIYECGPFTT